MNPRFYLRFQPEFTEVFRQFKHDHATTRNGTFTTRLLTVLLTPFSVVLGFEASGSTNAGLNNLSQKYLALFGTGEVEQYSDLGQLSSTLAWQTSNPGSGTRNGIRCNEEPIISTAESRRS